MNSHESRSPIVANQADSHKDTDGMVALAKQLESYVREAARARKPMHEVEQTVLGMVLRMGYTALEGFIAAQGDGDLGETVTTDDGET